MKDKLTLKWIGQGVRGQGGKFAFVVVAVVLNAAITVLYAVSYTHLTLPTIRLV